MPTLSRRLLFAVLVAVCGVNRIGAQQGVSAAVRTALQSRAGRYPLVSVALFGHDSALIVFDDSSYTGKARSAGTWMFGPPVTEAEADHCPPEKVLGRQIARVLWKNGGKALALKSVIVRVRGVSGLDRLSWTDMYYEPSQLEGPWAGDPSNR
jgi:hypothetical protein